MKLLLLHPLPLDGSIFSDDLRALADECVAPTLYDAGDDISDWALTTQPGPLRAGCWAAAGQRP